jgi:hypothetical protein
MRAAIDALEGRRAESAAGYREALARLAGHGLRLSQVFVGIGVAATLGGGSPDTAQMVDEVRAVITELRALPLADRLDEALARHAPVEQPYRSIGTPTMLPHSVQEPS